ncbi:NADase-type glycan-binding domain-containing protein [Nocardioides sp. MAHUQ-72]|uniref:NADase-type glycan-binding domain-containing protein n=1 Tax=unclassified Nocardioides TaxID=2615069 RepID=UPI003613A271
MDTCASCGHELGGGRFCTACGAEVQELRAPAPAPGAGQHRADVAVDHDERTRQIPRLPVDADPDDWRTGTAERPAVDGGATRPVPTVPTTPPPTTPPPTTPPPAAAPGPVGPPPAGPPRQPGRPGPAGAPPPPPAGTDGPRFPLFADEVVPAPEPPAGDPHRAGRGWLAWAVGATVLVLVAALGGWLLLGGDDEQPARAEAKSTAKKEPGGSGKQPSTAPDGEPGDLAREATAKVPATAPPNQDTSGNMVRYDARNMLDGVASTCWRMAGDGSGEEITFDLPTDTRLTAVGMINGYAKVAADQRGRSLDWYHGNRRVLTVEWAFDDGTTVTQALRDTMRMQTLRIEPVTTRTVTLRLLSVSKPGKGRAARNYTPISDVTLRGAPG